MRQNALQKGDVLSVARIAAVQAVKRTSDLIPLAHGGVPVEGCTVRVEPVGAALLSDPPDDDDDDDDNDNAPPPPPERADAPPPLRQGGQRGVVVEDALRLREPVGPYGGVRVSVRVETTAKTGVEMEALTGVVGAALTVVDMCKGVDGGCVVGGVGVVGKRGGRGGGLGIWREGPDREPGGGGSEGLGGREGESGGGLVEEPRLVDGGEEGEGEGEGEEGVFEQVAAESERVSKGKVWKKWTPDRGSE